MTFDSLSRKKISFLTIEVDNLKIILWEFLVLLSFWVDKKTIFVHKYKNLSVGFRATLNLCKIDIINTNAAERFFCVKTKTF